MISLGAIVRDALLMGASVDLADLGSFRVYVPSSMAYNFMSLFRHALINSDKKKFLKTIRYELISTPAYLGKKKDKHILYLARSLKTRKSFLSIGEKLKDFSLQYSTEKS